MIAAILLAAAPMSAIDAERAFAADAQKHGQWTAFKKWSEPYAAMFVPEPVEAHTFLKDKADPPASVFWWPTRSFVSCDEKTAINYGPWVRDAGRSVGYFTTVWHKGTNGWRWVLDHGDALKEVKIAGQEPVVRKASCSGTPPLDSGDPSYPMLGKGFSLDGTVAWQWMVGSDGSRTFTAYLFNGADYEVVLDQQVDASAP